MRYPRPANARRPRLIPLPVRITQSDEVLAAMATINDVEAAVRRLAPQKAELEAERETKKRADADAIEAQRRRFALAGRQWALNDANYEELVKLPSDWDFAKSWKADCDNKDRAIKGLGVSDELHATAVFSLDSMHAYLAGARDAWREISARL
jgi:hypothetical protein